jgi:CBS domain-containing protein
MTRAQVVAGTPLLQLDAACAADVMKPSPTSIGARATVEEALDLFAVKGYTAAPVIDESGRPVGVVSRGDILTHEREKLHAGHSANGADMTRVGDIMTPAVFSVTSHTPIDSIVEQMLTLNVQQLYVVDDDQLLVGVVTAQSILERLRPFDAG